MSSAGSSDVYVAKLDAAGGHLWSKRFGDSQAQSQIDVAVDELDGIALVGDFLGEIDLGGGPLTAVNPLKKSIFVAKLSPAGDHIWSKRFGDDQDQWGERIAVFDAHHVLVAGRFFSTVDFGGGSLVNGGGAPDLFLTKLRTQ